MEAGYNGLLKNGKDAIFEKRKPKAFARARDRRGGAGQ
jgi:hypothetical protein